MCQQKTSAFVISTRKMNTKVAKGGRGDQVPLCSPLRTVHHLPQALQTEGFWNCFTTCGGFPRCQEQMDRIRGILSFSRASPGKKSHRSAPTPQGKDCNGTFGAKPKMTTCPYPTMEQDWLIGLARTDEKKKRRKERKTSSVGGDVVAAPSALCLGGACLVKQQKHTAGDGVKPTCNTSSWL